MLLWNFRVLGWANGYSFLLTVFEHHVLRRKQQNGNCSSKMLTCGMAQSRWPATASKQVCAMPLTSVACAPHVPACGNLLRLLLEPFCGGQQTWLNRTSSRGGTGSPRFLRDNLSEEEPKENWNSAYILDFLGPSTRVIGFRPFCVNEI